MPIARRHISWTEVEDLIVYLALVVVGAIPVTSALARRAGLGAEATIGLVLMFLGVVGLTYLAWPRRDRPA